MSYLGISEVPNFFLGVDTIDTKPCEEQNEKLISGVYFLTRNSYYV